jgi:hypothetical protein
MNYKKLQLVTIKRRYFENICDGKINTGSPNVPDEKFIPFVFMN